MRLSKTYLYIIIVLGFGGCLEPFNPEVPESSKGFLVVDGQITDQPGPYTVKVGKSASINGENTLVSGIEMFIEDDEGNIENLSETSSGIYQTGSLQAEAGKSYRLNFTYQGENFQSSWETIEVSPTIDSIYFQEVSKATTNQDQDLLGIQFFIDNNGTQNGSRYFRYEWEETWKIGVNWPSFFDYVGSDIIERTTNPLHTCWKNANPTGINLGSTLGLTQNKLSAHKLGFITGTDERFTRRYSILIKQFTIDENEYLFWKNLQESNEELGSLFDRQPARVVSNIKNLSDTENIVLGYFSSSGALERRLFISPGQVPGELTRRPMCQNLDTLLKADLGDAYEETLLRELRSNLFYQLHFPEVPTIEPIGALLAAPSCADCTKKGGDLNKPDFWDE